MRLRGEVTRARAALREILGMPEPPEYTWRVRVNAIARRALGEEEMDKHTPGPWVSRGAVADFTVWREPYMDEGFRVHKPVAQALAVGGMTFDERKANALLIAAAPELLAALKKAHACATLQDDGTCLGCFVSEAIAKAEGR